MTQAPFPFGRLPLLRIVLVLALGIVLGFYLAYPSVFLFAIGSFLILNGVLSHFLVGLPQKTLFKNSMYHLVILGIGGFSSAMHVNETTNKLSELGDLAGLRAQVFAKVADKKTTDYGFRLLLDVDSLRFSESRMILAPHRSLAYVDSVPSNLKPYAQIEMSGALIKAPQKRWGQDFDYGFYLESQGIWSRWSVDSLRIVGRHNPKGIAVLRNSLEARIDTLFPTHSAVVKALILGEKNELRPQIQREFQRSGLSHLMAVSGLHVGILLAPIMLLLPWARLQTGRSAALLVLTAGLLFFYAWLLGFPPSVVRASLMAVLFLLGSLFALAAHPVNILSAAALVILLFDPRALFNIGFQLSFGAVLAIILFLTPIQMRLYERFGAGWKTKLATLVLLTVIIQLALSPLLVFSFGEISVIAPLANLPAVFTATGLVWSVVASLLLSGIWFEAAQILTFASHYLAEFLQTQAHFFSSVDYASLAWTNPDWKWMLLLFCLLATTLSLKRPGLRRTLIGVQVLLLATISTQNLFAIFHETADPFDLEVLVFDVGQGDATLITTPNQKHILVDSGPAFEDYTAFEHIILPYLKKHSIYELDALILSHPHHDHHGGTPAVLKNVNVKELIEARPAQAEKNGSFEAKYRHLASERGTHIRFVKAGDDLDIDSALWISVLSPAEGLMESSHINDDSIVLRIQYGKTVLLLTGDAELEAEHFMLEHVKGWLDADFLKAGHHGSRTSSSAVFLDEVSPRWISVSNGWRNRYQHPHPETVASFQSRDAELFFTALEGSLRFTFTPNIQMRVETEHTSKAEFGKEDTGSMD